MLRAVFIIVQAISSFTSLLATDAVLIACGLNACSSACSLVDLEGHNGDGDLDLCLMMVSLLLSLKDLESVITVPYIQ